MTVKIHYFFSFLFIILPISAESPGLFTGISGTWAQETLARLTLDKKIGQLFVVAAIVDRHSKENDILMQHTPYNMDKSYIEHLINDFHVGGIIFMGLAQPEDHVRLTNHFQQLSSIPLLVCMDFEWGLSMRLKNTVRFPRNMPLGAIQDDTLIYEMGKEIARQCKELGVHVNLAPVVDVNNNPANPIINDRSFGEDKEVVVRKAMLYMRGLQDGGIIACAKHFPGHGDTAVDSHKDLPLIPHSLKRLHAVELYPFINMIDAGVYGVMLAHLEIPALEPTPNLPASLSYDVVTGLLKKELGFNGLVMTDGLGMQGILKHHAPGELELKAILAGNDILLCPMDVPKAVALIKQAIADGRFSEEELNRRVLKILRAKEWAFKHAAQPHAYNREALHTASAYDLKQQLYAAAITLAQNKGNLLPLSSMRGVPYVQIGDTPFEEFKLTIKEYADITHHYLPAQADQEQMEQLLATLQHNNVVVIGVYQMNKFINQNFGLSLSTMYFINTLIAQGKKVILVLFGNTYSLQRFGEATAIILAYEDDPDAQIAAAKVIMGKLNPTGKLPVSASEQFKMGSGLSFY